MVIIARRAVQLDGHIFRKGEARDYAGAVDERIAANFTAEDGSALVPSPDGADGGKGAGGGAAEAEAALVARTAKRLRRQGVCQQLDAMNVTYPADASTESLARLLLVQKGEIGG